MVSKQTEEKESSSAQQAISNTNEFVRFADIDHVIAVECDVSNACKIFALWILVHCLLSTV